MTSRLRIIVTGLIAQHPRLGGVTWDYVQYVLGLARLGHDVYYVEDSGEWPYNFDGGPSGDDWVARDCKANVAHLAEIMSRFGLAENWAYRFPITGGWYGLSDAKRRNIIDSAELILNVSGLFEHPDEYGRAGRLAYIDSDPVFTQVKLARGDLKFCARVNAHHVHFSFGECLSAAGPRTAHRWRPTRQPIVLSEWHPSLRHRDAFTTVMSWTSYKPLTFAGRTYAQKDVELTKFLQLPNQAPRGTLEIALGTTEHADWEQQDSVSARVDQPTAGRPRSTARDLLRDAGWHVVDAMQLCGDLESYRRYLVSSKAEWSVAKNGYVVGQPGWFSCRSACYLAAGRPVVVQDTGFSSILPVGEGILTFRTLDEAAWAIREIEGDYEQHSKTARAIAEEYFDSGKVLTRLIDDALSSEPNSGSEWIPPRGGAQVSGSGWDPRAFS